MKPIARIINQTTCGNLTAADFAAYAELRLRIKGWPSLQHMAFFKAVLAELFSTEAVPSLLVCGVYHGMDLAMIEGLAERHRPPRPMQLVGVDLFSSAPCADWPEEKRGMTWEQAFGCPPPSLEIAQRNVKRAQLVPVSSVDYLARHSHEFDFIYLDTSHDEATVRSELTPILCNARAPGLIIAGDDYSEQGGGFTSGVQRAVEGLLPEHNVLFDRIWISPP